MKGPTKLEQLEKAIEEQEAKIQILEKAIEREQEVKKEQLEVSLAHSKHEKKLVSEITSLRKVRPLY